MKLFTMIKQLSLLYYALYSPSFFWVKTPFLKGQFRLKRLSSPPDSDPCIGTEDATLPGRNKGRYYSLDSYEE
jgi:hypothetical protein